MQLSGDILTSSECSQQQVHRCACAAGTHAERGIERVRPVPRWVLLPDFFSTPMTVAAWVITLGAYVHPAHGTGFLTCPVHAMTGVECHGCGLTRSISCAARCMVRESVAYHPFGLIIFALFALLALISLLPRRIRGSARQWTLRRRTPLAAVCTATAFAFIVHGFIRMISS